MKNNFGIHTQNDHDQLLKHLESFHKKLRPFGDLPIEFHWSDSAKLIKVFQSKIKNDESFNKSFRAVEQKFLKLKDEKLWLRKDDFIISMSLFDIYFTLINHLKNGEYEDQLFNSQEVSFVGPTGPFMNVTMIELVTQQLFKEFLYFNILKNKIPQRSFRLHTTGEVVMQFGEKFEKYSIVEICQITDNGVLFSCKDDLVLEEISHGPMVKFHMDSTSVNKLMEGELIEFSNTKNLFATDCKLKYFTVEYEKIIKSLSYNSGISGKFYLFVRYINMNGTDIPSVFKDFVEQMKDSVNKAAS